MKLCEMMTRDLGIDPDYIMFCSKRNNLYAKYYIPKKNGGKREILQPSKELKVLQRWLVRNIFSYFPISEFSTAYSKGNSVRKNALLHQNSGYILHTDIKAFFPSIKREMLLDFFEKNKAIVDKIGLTAEDIQLILNICLYKGQYLVVGSVASPCIANIYMYEFDSSLYQKLSNIGKFNYTRYADDIIISSGKYIPKELIGLVENELSNLHLQLNDKKTYFMNKSNKRQITGVVMDNNKNRLSIGNKKYKLLKREMYNYFVKSEGDLGHIKGYLSYVRGINFEQYEQLERIYKRYDKKNEVFKR